TRHRAEDAGADRFELGCKQHDRVGVEAYERAVRTPHAFRGAHHHSVIDFALFHSTAWRRVLDADLDHVANRGVTALRAAEHLDAHDGARAGIVGDIENRLHLNHWASPSNLPGARIGQFWAPSGAKKTRILVRRRCCWQGSRRAFGHTSLDFSISRVTVHDFVFEIGRPS